MAVDWTFLEAREGFTTKGIVPTNEDGTPAPNAGVTVGTGVDFGEKTEDYLKSIGVSNKIIKKVKPYLKANGKEIKGQAAIDALQQNPLQLEEGEARELSQAIKQDELARLKKWFNKNNKAGQDWSDLSDRQQTVALSVSYQYGVGYKKAPNFRDQILNNQWDKAAENLRNFGDAFPGRRVRELQYLIGAGVDGNAGQETDTKLAAFKQAFQSTGQVPTVAAAPTSPVDTQQAAQTAATAASQANPSDLLTTLAQSLGELLKSSQGASQAVSEPSTGPVTADTEVRDTESEDVAAARGEEDPLEAFIQSAIDYEEPAVEPEAEEDLDKFIQWASGTEETAPPVYVKTEGDWNGDRDPTYGIF